jgi:hypothetical protein
MSVTNNLLWVGPSLCLSNFESFWYKINHRTKPFYRFVFSPLENGAHEYTAQNYALHRAVFPVISAQTL